MTLEDGQSEIRRTEYTPPASRVVEHYCRRVCREMGEQFTEAEIMEGFTQFMKVAVKVKLRELKGAFGIGGELRQHAKGHEIGWTK